MRIDVSIMGTPLERVPASVETLARAGVDGIFSAEGPHDVFAPLFLAAGTPSHMALMTNAAIAFPRNPIHLAHSAFDLQRLSRGNFRLGIAPQVLAHIERRFGLTWSDPLGRMEDLIGALRAIFSNWQDGQALDYRGAYYAHTLMTPMFSPGPLEWGAPRIILGGLGPSMTKLAASSADGVSILPFNSEELLHSTSAPAIEQGLDASGRTRDAFEVICGVIVGLGDDDGELENASMSTRSLLGFYGSTKAYGRVLESIDRAEAGPRLAALVRQGGYAEVADLVDKVMVDRLAVVAPPEEAAQRVLERLGWFADRVAVFFPFEPTPEQLQRFVSVLHG